MALGVLLALMLAAAAPVAYAAKGVDNTAELKAREAFAAGRYDEALDLFAKLYAQTLHPVYLRNIGRCHQKMRQPEKAIDKFNEYRAKDKKISADERKEIEGYIKEMEALRDQQAKQSAPPPPAPPPVTPGNPRSSPPPAARREPPAAAAHGDDLRDAGRAAGPPGGDARLQEVVVLDRHRGGGRGRRRRRDPGVERRDHAARLSGRRHVRTLTRAPRRMRNEAEPLVVVSLTTATPTADFWSPPITARR